MFTALVVDDEFTIADSIAELLQWEGYATRVAANGALALKELEKGGIDFVLLDYMMPVMDGVQFLERLRASEQWKTLPVVMISAIAERSIPGSGWDAYLAKPFEIDDLLAVVTRLGEKAGRR